MVDRLIGDVAHLAAPLPWLSFALEEMYLRCAERNQQGDLDRTLRETDYDAFGGVAGALAQRASAVHRGLLAQDPAYATTLRFLFTRMIATVQGKAARRRALRHELVGKDPAENRRITSVLEHLHEVRLISLGSELSEDAAGGYAEPLHDAVVDGWHASAEWLREQTP